MIEVKHDHKLNFPEIHVPMYNEDQPDGPNIIKQTEIEGTLVPLLRFNDQVITFEMVNYMALKCGTVPSITIEITDYLDLIRLIDTPGRDNILYLQILPPFDDAYKKIQLAFYITDTNIDGQTITMSGTYYVPKLFDNVMKPYGCLSTYELFEKVSNDYSLGFCSNVTGMDDERYIYNPNQKPIQFLSKEIQFAGNKEHVYDWWIDLWNNINLVDLYTEYTTIEKDEDLLVWVGNNFKDTDNENHPQQQIAAFTNIPAMAASPFYIGEYEPTSSTGGCTDMNLEVYSMNNADRLSTVIQDGDVYNDIFMEYTYGGEVFGDFDYISQKASRNFFLGKIQANCIKITTNLPILALMRGGHVNLWWYETNNWLADKIDFSEVESNISIPDGDGKFSSDDLTMTLNRTVSGQYYIMDIEYNYLGHMNWEVIYTLSRAAESVQKLNPPTNETFLK